MRAALARTTPQAPESLAPALDRMIDALSAAIERYKLECDKFLNGATLILPEEPRARIARGLRDLRQVHQRGVAENFRLGTLEARFNALSERFNRLLKAREEGRLPGSAARPVSEESAPRFDAAAGVVIDSELEGGAVHALYAGLTHRGANRLDLESFRGYLAQQLEAIRAKTGAAAVQFRVAEEDGKLKLKAKPVGAPV